MRRISFVVSAEPVLETKKRDSGSHTVDVEQSHTVDVEQRMVILFNDRKHTRSNALLSILSPVKIDIISWRVPAE